MLLIPERMAQAFMAVLRAAASAPTTWSMLLAAVAYHMECHVSKAHLRI